MGGQCEFHFLSEENRPNIIPCIYGCFNRYTYVCCKNRIFSWPSGYAGIAVTWNFRIPCCSGKEKILSIWFKKKKDKQSLELSAAQNFATVIIHIINKQSKRSGVQGCGKRALWFSVSALPVNHFAVLGKWLNLVGARCVELCSGWAAFRGPQTRAFETARRRCRDPEERWHVNVIQHYHGFIPPDIQMS